MSVSAVFDCMVFLQGAARPLGPARRCLELVDSGEVTLFLSTAVLAELDDVLTRPKTLHRFPDLTRPDARRLVRSVHSAAITLATVPAIFKYPRDPKDEPYVNLAIAASARFLVSRDKDLLDLMRQGQII